MKTPEPEFPHDCCGCCGHCHLDSDGDHLCWGAPPQAVTVDFEAVYVRGIPVDPAFPPCHFFKPKH